MLRKPSVAVFATSLYLLVYVILFNFDYDFRILFWMFLGSPFLLGWMAYTIVRYGKFTGDELKENEEWGYSDRTRDTLGTF